MRRIIGITPAEDVFREQERISAMIRSGRVTYFHIRKPDYDETQMRNYLQQFDLDVRERLSLHDFHTLADELHIGGIHLNRRHPVPPASAQSKRISVSCHSVEEVLQWKAKADYCFLSPIFDSISKQGYKSHFALDELRQLFNEHILNDKVCALAGVTYENMALLEDVGFTSCVMLSSLWELPKTMFITHHNERYDYVSGALAVLEGGIRFIQLRMKDASDEEVLTAARQLRPACDQHGALLTVDDRIHLLESGLFDGVHVGKNDLPVAEAKKVTGKRFLLGATCNSAEDMLKAAEDGANYIGLGPFRFTTTKKNLSTILGIEGYRERMVFMRNHELHLPVYAIGGITPADLPELKATGVHGVAVSSVILDSLSPENTINQIIKIF